MSAFTPLSYGIGNTDEVLSLTWSNMIPDIKDNVFNENTALGWFYKTGKKSIKGGASISHGLMYGGNAGAGSYARYDILNVAPTDGLTRDQWVWKQYECPVTIDGFLERDANQGEYALADALETKRKQSEGAIRNLLETAIFAASPATNDLRSLPVIVLDSGTEGQINGTTNTWFRAVNNAAGSWAAGIGRTQLVNTINTCMKRNPVGKSDLLLSDQTSMEAYEGTLVPQYRYESNKGDLGLSDDLTFKGIPWKWSVQATSGVIYVLNSDAIVFYVSKATDFLFTGFKIPTNQDAKVGHILLTTALATTSRRKLGKTTSNAA